VLSGRQEPTIDDIRGTDRLREFCLLEAASLAAQQAATTLPIVIDRVADPFLPWLHSPSQ
jgi:hypothetical protein